GGEPGQIEALRPLFFRADTIFPVVAGNEVAPGIADDGRPELLDQGQHVAAKSVLVRSRMARLIDAAIDAAAQMFDERPEQAGHGVADGEIPVEHDQGLSHGCFLSSSLQMVVDFGANNPTLSGVRTAARSARAYGCCGADRTERASPISTTAPFCMMIRRSE